MLEIILLFGKHQENKSTFGQHNLFLGYILSAKPIPGLCFVHNHCADHLIWLNITYSWHTFCQQNIFLAYILFTLTKLAT